MFWLMELDLISLKGSSVYNSRFWGVYEFSMTLDSPLGFGSVRHATLKWPSWHILVVASLLLIPGIFAETSILPSHPVLQAKTF